MSLLILSHYLGKPAAMNPAEPTQTLVRRVRPTGEVSAQTRDVSGNPVADVPVVILPVAEIGGRKDGTEPTRFGDWEKNGRCVDF